MGNFLSRLNPFSKERRGKVSDPRYWPELFGKLYGVVSQSGITVSADNAMQSSAVYACVRVLAETVASLPLQIFQRRKDGGKTLLNNHPLYYLLHDSPNRYQTSFEHREMYMGHLCLRGNAYDLIIKNGTEITELIPLHPGNMKPLLDDNGLAGYEYDKKGEKVRFTPEQIWHKKALSVDGVMGKGVVEVARDSIGLSMASEKYQSKFFANATKTSGALKLPGKLSEQAYKRLKDQWSGAYADLDKAWSVAIMEEGLEWQQMGMTNKDSQFLELRNFQIEDIARIFRVPVVLLQHQDKSSTYASAEQFFLSFIVHSIRPWLIRIEQSINKYLLTDKDRKAGIFAEHKIDALLRADIEKRYNAYAIALQNKFMNANEVRALENMNPRANGDEFVNPNIGM